MWDNVPNKTDQSSNIPYESVPIYICLLYTSDAADE